jgi:hypothetical protein
MADPFPLGAIPLDGSPEPAQTEYETPSQQAPAKKEPLSFHDLPREIRAQIFKECCFDEYQGWMPAGLRRPNPYKPLLVALRPQPDPYTQLLIISYQLDTVYLDSTNGWSLDGMSHSAVSMITKMHIIIKE